MAVDTSILTLAFITGVTADQLIRREVRGQAVPALSTALSQVVDTLPLLVVMGLTVFTLNGFYNRGRFYRSRYKVLAIAQGTSLTFLLFASAAYALKGYLQFPTAAAIALSALAALGLLLFARVYSHIWVRLLPQPQDLVPANNNLQAGNLALVIGGAGYIGSSLLPQLLEAGYRVRVFDSLLFGRDTIASHLEDERVDLLEGDFRRIDQLVAAMRDVDVVIHLGGLVGDPACAVDEELTIEINLSATRAIAELAKAQGVKRFIFASTCSVYGASDEIVDERSLLNPVSLYAQSKIASERVLWDLSSPDFRPTVMRFGTVYGLSGRTRFDLVVNLLTAKAATDGVITVFGPDQWRPFVHVADVAQALALAAQAPESVVASRVFNVGSNEQNATLGELGRLIREHVPNAQIVVSEMDSDSRNYRVSFDRIANELKFTPRWSLGDGIEQVLEFVRSGGIGHYSADEYSNVKVLLGHLGQETVGAYRSHHLELLESRTGFLEIDELADAQHAGGSQKQGKT